MPVGDGLADEDGEPVGDGLPDELETGAVGVQLGVGDPAAPWLPGLPGLNGAMLPPFELGLDDRLVAEVRFFAVVLVEG